ncbi:MAG: cytochrome c [Thiohalomonadaceae bacterium]
MKKMPLILAGALALGAAFSASADQFEDAIAARKAAFVLIKSNFGPMGAMVEGKMPFDKEAFAKRAANLSALAGMPWEHFIEGSDMGETKAKPEVWSKAADYKAEVDKFEAAVAKLALVAKSGDENAIKAEFGAAAKTCKSCHTDFKNK